MKTTDEFIQQRILIIDDEEGIRYTLSGLLRHEGFVVDTAAARVQALELFQRYEYDVAFVDIVLNEDNGLNLIRDIRESAANVQVVMITGRPDVDSAATAVRLGAFDYITKPFRPEAIVNIARHAMKTKQLADERERHRANLDAIFSSVPDAIIMADRDLRLLQFNPSASECGYDEGLVGVPIDAIDLGCAGACRKVLAQSLISGSPVRMGRMECCRADGTMRRVSLRATPVTEADGTVKGAVAVIRDETRLETLEKALSQRDHFYGMIGRNERMLKLYSLIEALSDVQTTVLINGESGTGKELVAAALHSCGRRRHGPLVKVNCSAISDSLLESELFGHVRGAFTGAIASKAGRFEKADGGTIFLDEIGDISPTMQMRLLRVLQEREIERVGDSNPIKVDVRIIAATNQDLAEKVRKGSFRQDLYYRINVVRLELPPLRERLEDLPLLADHFLKMYNQEMGKSVCSFSDDVMSCFMRYLWPGNIRQLEHVIEHCCILCRTDTVTIADLPQELLLLSDPSQSQELPSPTKETSISLEKALELANGNKTEAARLLGISRRTVYRHLSH